MLRSVKSVLFIITSSTLHEKIEATKRKLNQVQSHLAITIGVQQIAIIAQKVGYESEAAFSKAFKRCIGSSPGDYRRSL
jgi:AraC-like DNA-binding protein